MYSRLTTKITVTIVGVVALALLSSVAALFATWHIGGLMRNSVAGSLPSLAPLKN